MNISVGILEGQSIGFQLNDTFLFKQELSEVSGKFDAKIFEKKVFFNGKIYDELFFENKNNSIFELKNVKIGVNFHWEQFEHQCFEGNLKIVSDGEKLIAINIIDIEKYLCSVISSEMSAMSFPELLKAHAVISRSWLLANNEKCRMKNEECKENEEQNSSFFTLNSSFIKWYERDAHSLFDVCADDHCQRYQGIGKGLISAVKNAVEATKSEVLMYENEICDTRYSKCCGGKTEIFSSCWADKDFDYLSAKDDSCHCEFDLQSIPAFAGMTDNIDAEKFIFSSPKCFCNTNDKDVINQVFKDFDKKTNDFFRWKVEYSNNELTEILCEKSGIDFGEIVDLIPLKRGKSGRITLLKIVGSKCALNVGKELEIRRWLSKSHLYSSAFVVEKDENGNFTLYGAGWGHGVGLCQIGAAVMSAQGYNYKEILAHYFEGAEIKKG